MFMFKKSLDMPSKAEALPGRPNPIRTAANHFFVNAHPLKGRIPRGTETAIFGMGCFWGAERKFWELGDGITTTAVGYAGRSYAEPDLRGGVLGRTGHNEVVLVVYDPKKVSYETLLKTFWENHDPTQGMRQGNDIGTQYRSASTRPRRRRRRPPRSRRRCTPRRRGARASGAITTEIIDAPEFYFAEDYHQQYLAKNPLGYCGLGGTGVSVRSAPA